MCNKRRFAAIFPHSDDFTLNAFGLMHSLLAAGYEGFWIRTTDDCMDSYGLSYGQTTALLEQETEEAARFLGIRKVYHLNYKNHDLHFFHLIELRHRLLLLLRYLKIDTVITFDPYGHYEENPDHDITGKAVEHAAWMAGRKSDLPETFDMGFKTQFVRDKYYFARGPQEANFEVDITPCLERKQQAIQIHRTPLDNMWKGYLEKHPEYSIEACPFEYFLNHFFLQPLQATPNERFRHVSSYEF